MFARVEPDVADTAIRDRVRRLHTTAVVRVVTSRRKIGMYSEDSLGGNMLQLTEDTVKTFIKDNERVFVKVWAQNCPYCTRLDEQLKNVDLSAFVLGSLEVSHPMDKAPKPSEFKRTWMRQDKSDVVKDSVPALFVFENGELKYRNFGMLYADQLSHWLKTGEVRPSELQKAEREANEKKQKLINLYAQRGELTYNMELMGARLGEINKAIGDLLK